jgi:thiamine biosynthesis lipoprotein
VGIDTGTGTQAPTLRLSRGALATSGDARRYLLKDGLRYSHVLDPRSGWPVPNAPRSVTVLATTCSEAGSHSTIALLKGADAGRYLQSVGVQHWIDRDTC